MGSAVCIMSYDLAPNRSLAEFETYPSKLNSVVDWSRPRQGNLFIAGDLNAKSVAWGSVSMFVKTGPNSLTQLRAACVTDSTLGLKDGVSKEKAERTVRSAFSFRVPRGKKIMVLDTLERGSWRSTYHILINKMHPWAPLLTVNVEPDLQQAMSVEYNETIREISSSELKTAIETKETAS
ncbi:unnamed protein product [Pieris brassicae]|uniref:Endonuclease/exonuclease/phosphatase domain-containing protein n=2 Tax=Pieris brassicae TaxID=7116 RepID=A0A9P0XKG8_PIEBR|nr:unnamed protein product [Pieris brassicae]